MVYPRLARAGAGGAGQGAGGARYADATLAHLEHFAAEGLRTLVFAVATIPNHVYKVT